MFRSTRSRYLGAEESPRNASCGRETIKVALTDELVPWRYLMDADVTLGDRTTKREAATARDDEMRTIATTETAIVLFLADTYGNRLLVRYDE